MIRREVLQSLAALAVVAPTLARGANVPGTAFSVARLRDLARRVAQAPYVQPPTVPKAWQALDHAQYAGIAFDPAQRLWRGEDVPMQVAFFPPGLYFHRPVRVEVVEDGLSRPLPFDWAAFTKTDQVPDLPMDDAVGYAGLKVLGQLDPGPDPRKTDLREFAVFLGASYFRMIGAPNAYGLSARGLTVNTANLEQGEEFPDFTRFWLERPAKGAGHMRLHALLESPSITGLYHVTLHPGEVTRAEVEVTLWPRADLGNVGVAPLTSMYFIGQTNRARFDDYRMAVHDSDGLRMLNGAGEQLWRPLANPAELQVSHFIDEGPKGFGLMQRARRFDDYGDMEGRFQDRPSLWITPRGDWGKGDVTLVEIPSGQENFDNIVAYWQPEGGLRAGTEQTLAYRMDWGMSPAPALPVAPVRSTLVGLSRYNPEKTVVAPIPGADIFGPNRQDFRIEFGAHPALPDDIGQIEAVVWSDHGKVSPGVLQINPDTGAPRLAFAFDPGDLRTAELRAQLRIEGRDVSEVWLYRWTV